MDGGIPCLTSYTVRQKIMLNLKLRQMSLLQKTLSQLTRKLHATCHCILS